MILMENPKGGNAKVVIFFIHIKFLGVHYFQILEFFFFIGYCLYMVKITLD
jgi:hypothetical protein